MIGTDRRGFIIKIAALLGGIAAAIMAIPVIGVIIEPLVRKIPRTWRSVGIKLMILKLEKLFW